MLRAARRSRAPSSCRAHTGICRHRRAPGRRRRDPPSDRHSRLVARLSGRGTALKAGEYEFPAGAQPDRTRSISSPSGRTVKHRLTVPEGLTSAEVVALVRDAPALDGDAGPAPRRRRRCCRRPTIYSYGDRRKELIERMRRGDGAALWRRPGTSARPDLPLASPQEAVILASIVEKEAAREEERPRIAGGLRQPAAPRHAAAGRSDGVVRAGRGQRRQARPAADACRSRDQLAVQHLSVKGLPPGPIANPGRASLRAAVRPERTDDLYFVADGTGGHVFAKTLADHNRNVALYRRGASPPRPNRDLPRRRRGAAGGSACSSCARPSALRRPAPTPAAAAPRPAAPPHRPKPTATAQRCVPAAGHPSARTERQR